MGLHINETLLNDEKYKKAAQSELKKFIGFVNDFTAGNMSKESQQAFFDLCTGKKDTVSYTDKKGNEKFLTFTALKADKVNTYDMSTLDMANHFMGFGNDVEDVNEKLGVFTESQMEKMEFSVNFTSMHGKTLNPNNREIDVVYKPTEEEIAENQKQIEENAFGKEFSSGREVNEESVKTILNDVKIKATEYNKINFFRRALSYINPFKDSVREMRKDINETKELLTENGIDKDQLENYVNGKADIDSVNLNNVEPVEEFDSRSTLNARVSRSKWPIDEDVQKSMNEMNGPEQNESFVEMDESIDLENNVNIE